MLQVSASRVLMNTLEISTNVLWCQKSPKALKSCMKLTSQLRPGVRAAAKQKADIIFNLSCFWVLPLGHADHWLFLCHAWVDVAGKQMCPLHAGIFIEAQYLLLPSLRVQFCTILCFRGPMEHKAYDFFRLSSLLVTFRVVEIEKGRWHCSLVLYLDLALGMHQTQKRNSRPIILMKDF